MRCRAARSWPSRSPGDAPATGCCASSPARRSSIAALEKIPPGALLVASKHQSVWETFALLPLFDDPAYIFKRELMWIPIFGWYAWKADMIPVDRNARGGALAGMIERVRDELARGRQIIIFPEGTRTAPGAPPAYKQGVTRLYAAADVPCLPIALNSGLFWPRRKFMRYPGTIRLEVLDPIPPGLDPEMFAARLERDIETATARLIAEGEQELAFTRGIAMVSSGDRFKFRYKALTAALLFTDKRTTS